jgi:multidrug efflux pump subunit AcrA (membrane-fusion protein)
MFKKTKTFLRAHKITSAIAVIALAGAGYYWYNSGNTATAITKYVVEDATQGSVIASVSGSGQVQAGTTINVTPKVSEEVTSIAVKVGDKVGVGQLLLQLDPTNEARALAQAKLSLQQAQLSAEQTNQVATTTLLQQQNAVLTGKQSIVDASTTFTADYQNGFNNLGPDFVNFQTIMQGLKSIVLGYDINKNQQDPDAFISLMPVDFQAGTLPYRNAFVNDYNFAQAAYEKNLADYQAVSPNASSGVMDALFTETYNTSQAVSAAVKAGKDFLDYVVTTYQSVDATKPLPAIITTFQNNLSGYRTTVNSSVSGLQTTITGISTDRNNITNTQNSLKQASETLNETLAGPTPTTLLSQQISVQSAENSLETAQQNYNYTSVRAPIGGTVSAIGAAVGQTAGSSALTIVSTNNVAQVTLNEDDAAKVITGDKATLTFDAISNLSLAGQVVEIDPVGTVSQGVVSYNVQISFSQPANTSSSNLVKPGMSVTANMVTQTAQNVLAVPNASLIASGSSTYILEPSVQLSAADLASSASGGILLSPAPKRVAVTTGLSNSGVTEITSGVNVGDQIVVQTIKSTTGTKTTTTGSTSALQLLGGTGGAARTGGTGGTGGFTRPPATP